VTESRLNERQIQLLTDCFRWGGRTWHFIFGEQVSTARALERRGLLVFLPKGDLNWRVQLTETGFLVAREFYAARQVLLDALKIKATLSRLFP